MFKLIARYDQSGNDPLHLKAYFPSQNAHCFTQSRGNLFQFDEQIQIRLWRCIAASA